MPRKVLLTTDFMRDTCAICLQDDILPTLENCPHRFHEECINIWINRPGSARCPSCRRPVAFEFSESFGEWVKRHWFSLAMFFLIFAIAGKIVYDNLFSLTIFFKKQKFKIGMIILSALFLLAFNFFFV